MTHTQIPPSLFYSVNVCSNRIIGPKTGADSGSPAELIDIYEVASLSTLFTSYVWFISDLIMPSVLWRCWLGGRKGIRPVKNLGGGRHLSGWGGAHPDCRYLCLHYLPLLHKKSRRQEVAKPSLNAALPMLRQKAECFFWYRPTRVVPEQMPLNGCCCWLSWILHDNNDSWYSGCCNNYFILMTRLLFCAE